jgi:hypothetical protein
MPFTVDNVNKYIDFEFIAGDPKGNSLANAVTAEDFRLAMVAAGVGAAWTKQGNQHLITGYSIRITGANTWVHFYNVCIEWTGAITQRYLISVGTGSNFYMGADSDYTKRGCILMANQTTAKAFIFRYNTFIYECTFQATTNQNYHLWFEGSAGSPVTLQRCQFINVSQIGNPGLYYLNNVIFDDNLMVGAYGIFYHATDDFLSINNLKAIGRITYMYSINATKTGRNWICPRGSILIRAYYNYEAGLNLIDSSIGGAISLVTNVSTAGHVGAKAFVDFYSTFSFYVENGDNATVKVWNKNDVLLLDSVLDGSGVLEDQELKYWEKSNTKITDAPDTFVVVDEKYTPFKVEITRAGWETLTIEGVEIVDGEPTNIFGTMVYPELFVSAVDITDCTEIGADDGEIVITAEGGDGTYEYSMDGVTYQASDTFTDLSPDDYTVYVRDGEGTVAAFDVTVSEPIPEAYAENVLSAELAEETLTCDLAEEILTCELTE